MMIAYAGVGVKVHSLTISVNQPKLSRHLAYLKRAGLLAGRKDGPNDLGYGQTLASLIISVDRQPSAA